MWLDIIKERRAELGYTIKHISQEANLPERTVSRIFSGDTPSPYADTLKHITDVLGLSLDETLADTKSVIGGKNYIVLHEENERLTAKIEELNAEIEKLSGEFALINTENIILKDKVGTFAAEIDLLRLKLEHKDELLSLHNYYINKHKTE